MGTGFVSVDKYTIPDISKDIKDGLAPILHGLDNKGNPLQKGVEKYFGIF